MQCHAVPCSAMQCHAVHCGNRQCAASWRQMIGRDAEALNARSTTHHTVTADEGIDRRASTETGAEVLRDVAMADRLHTKGMQAFRNGENNQTQSFCKTDNAQARLLVVICACHHQPQLIGIRRARYQLQSHLPQNYSETSCGFALLLVMRLVRWQTCSVCCLRLSEKFTVQKVGI